MRIGSRGAIAIAGAASLLVAAGGTGAAPTTAPAASTASVAPADSSAPAASASGSAAAQGLPYTATLKDGSTFTLNPRVADKLTNNEPINYVFSYGSTAIPLFSPQYKAGYDRTLPEAQKVLPMNGQAIAPAS